MIRAKEGRIGCSVPALLEILELLSPGAKDLEGKDPLVLHGLNKEIAWAYKFSGHKTVEDATKKKHVLTQVLNVLEMVAVDRFSLASCMIRNLACIGYVEPTFEDAQSFFPDLMIPKDNVHLGKHLMIGPARIPGRVLIWDPSVISND